MIKYLLRRLNVIVFLESDDPNASAAIQCEGDAERVEVARYYLSAQYGAFGHLIGSATTPIDLDAAILSPKMQEYRPELVEGAELVEKYDPGIPEGAIT